MFRIHDDLWIVPGRPVLYVPSLKYLVIADLHLGFEEEMASKGVYLPRVQLDKIISMLEEILDSSGLRVEGIIVNGDLKHSFSRLTRREREEAERLLGFLEKRGLRVELIRGNHDNYLAIVAHRHGLELRDRLVHLDLVLTHGHLDLSPPGPGRIVVIGHEHPALVVRDTIGSVARFPCFLDIPLDTGGRMLVMPAAGPYQSGNPVSLRRTNYLSPLTRKHGVVEEARPYVIDEEVGVLEFPPLRAMADLIADT